MSTSAQRLADIVSLKDLVFYVAPHDGHVIILAVMLYRIFLLHVYFNLALRSSRKYLYPPWKGFLLWPPNLWIFQNWLIKWTPPIPPRNIIIPCGNQKKLFFKRKIPNLYPYLKDAYHRICDTKIIDLIPSIPLHNFDKTAFTKKVPFKDHWERKVEKEMLYSTSV